MMFPLQPTLLIHTVREQSEAGAVVVPAAHKGLSDSVWRINLATRERK